MDLVSDHLGQLQFNNSVWYIRVVNCSDFNIENIDGGHGGRYRCVARNPCGTTNGNYFTLSG